MTFSSPQLRAVVFDYGGVLTLPPTDQEWQALAGIINVPLPQLLEEYWKARNDYDMGKFDSATYWRDIAHIFERQLTDDDILKLVEADCQQWGRENSNIIAIMRAVHTAGLKTAILSNIQSDMLSFLLKHYSWISEFDVQVFSHELGIAKPAPEIFQYTTKLLGLQPSEILFVDDRQLNVEGAEQVGMKAMLYDSPESYRKLEQLLISLGVPLTSTTGCPCCSAGT